MVLITIREVIYLVAASFVVGYIFSGYVKKPSKDVIDQYNTGFSWENLKFATMIATPGIVLHELAHKFVAMGFGLNAVFEIWPTGLAVGVILKLLGSGFMLLAPGYVSILGVTSGLQQVLISFAGPAVNLLLWLGASHFVKRKNNLSRNQAIGLFVIAEMNKWLFIFNMLPLPPLDGYKVFSGLFSLIF